MSKPQEWAVQVLELATLMAEIALKHYRSELTVEIKGDGSPVTVADRAAEDAARTWLHEHFPQDGILGEEFGEQTGQSGRRWIVDPVDGTKAFIRGVPLWGSLVALCEGESVLAGAAVFPVVREAITAARGIGCYWNNRLARVSSLSSIEAATVLTTDTGFREAPSRRAGWDRLTQAAAIGRTWGDCYGYLLVATGRAEAMVDPILCPWDAAALKPIVEEAGGVFTDWDNHPTAFGGSAVATNRALADAVRVQLRG